MHQSPQEIFHGIRISEKDQRTLESRIFNTQQRLRHKEEMLETFECKIRLYSKAHARGLEKIQRRNEKATKVVNALGGANVALGLFIWAFYYGFTKDPTLLTTPELKNLLTVWDISMIGEPWRSLAINSAIWAGSHGVRQVKVERDRKKLGRGIKRKLEQLTV